MTPEDIADRIILMDRELDLARKAVREAEEELANVRERKVRFCQEVGLAPLGKLHREEIARLANRIEVRSTDCYTCGNEFMYISVWDCDTCIECWERKNPGKKSNMIVIKHLVELK